MTEIDKIREFKKRREALIPISKEINGFVYDVSFPKPRNPQLPLKKKITHFRQFPKDTADVYRKIYYSLKELNTKPFELYAIGSRVKGTWQTEEEVDSNPMEGVPKYSDYDYYTNAENIPTSEYLVEKTGKWCECGPRRDIIFGFRITEQDLI